MDTLFPHRVFCIHLPHRTDRLAHVQQELDAMGWTDRSEIFPGISHPNVHGSIGCFQSHVAVLRHAKSQQYPNVAILEDDILITEKAQLQYRMTAFLQSMSDSNWDVLLLGGNVRNMAEDGGVRRRDQEDDEIVAGRVYDAFSTVGYIVQQSYYDRLLEHLEKGLAKLIATRQYRDYAIDVWWKALQRTDRWYTILPLMVSQMVSYSDIEQKIVNYHQVMLTPTTLPPSPSHHRRNGQPMIFSSWQIPFSSSSSSSSLR